MAKRKRKALARKKTASKRGKARTRAKSASKKVAKRTGAKTKAKKTVTRARGKTRAKKVAKRAAAKARVGKHRVPKKAAPRTLEPPRTAAEFPDETVIVDIIEEPAPGVLVVTEFEAVRTTRPETPTPPPEGGEGYGAAETEEKED